MENMILGDDLVRRDGGGGLSLDDVSSAMGGIATNLGGIVAPGATGVTSVHFAAPTTVTDSGSASTSVLSQTTTVAASAPASSAASSSADRSSSGVNSTTLIAILVPVCVLLAAVPTAAYLIYLRKRDKKQREEAEMLRGRGANSSSGATGEALLMRRSMSAASQHERKFASVSSAELELGAGGAALEKSISHGSYRHESGIFSPANHGPSRNRSQQTSMDSQRRPGFKPAPIASQSPTLPPLDFGKDDVNFSPLNSNTGNPGYVPTPITKPTVPATLPTFAPTQAKQRAPNPALNPGRSTASPAPGDAPSWPLPADGLRDSSSTYSSVATERPSPYQNKPLPPSALNKETTQTSASAAAARQQQQQQRGPRESSIAYGVPPVPPSPEADRSFNPDRRSNVSRKRDSDAISELSYSASTRGRRDTRRDTDAISIVSALSQHDR